MPDTSLQQLASKILAQAIIEVFPGAILVDGNYSNVLFQYSAILPQKIDQTLVCLIEEKMRGIIKSHPEFRTTEMVPKNAAAYFEYHQQPVLAEKAHNSTDTLIPIIEIGKFKDLCEPGELPTEFQTFFFEIIDLKQDQLEGEWISNFTGSAAVDKDSVKKFVKHYKQAKRYDHKVIGPELQLFTPLSDEEWVWLPRGEQLKNELLRLKLNSVLVNTPKDLTPDDIGFPHNLSFNSTTAWHTWLYQNSTFSPAKYTSIAQYIDLVPPSQLNGFLRNRFYTQDLTHSYCDVKDVEKELIYSLQFVDKIIKIFGFEVQWILRTERPNSKAKAADWDQGVKALTSAAHSLGLNVEHINAPGANLGPKLEAQLHDAFGQQWCGSFIQIDCCHPKIKLMASNKNASSALNTPKMIALSVWGSLERTVALLVEQRQGRIQWPALLNEVRGKMNSINEESISSIES